MRPIKFSIFYILAIIRYCQKIQAHWSFTFPFQASHYEMLRIIFFLNRFVLSLLPFPPNAIWNPNFTLNKLIYICKSLESISALSGFGWILAITQEQCSLVWVLRAQILGSNSNFSTYHIGHLGQGTKIILSSVSTSITERKNSFRIIMRIK